MPIKICQGCGKEFESPTGRGKYCVGSCYRNYERAYSRRHRATFSPERRRASELVYVAVNRGHLIRQPCEVCKALHSEAHHDDYAAPLDVRWLCRSHHKQHHLQFGPGLNSFRAEEVA